MRSPRLSDVKRKIGGEQHAHSHLGAYLNWMRSDGDEGAAKAESLTADLIETFGTDEGLRTLILFEKAVLMAAVPNGAPDGALREINAVRNFVLEIRRLVANG